MLRTCSWRNSACHTSHKRRGVRCMTRWQQKHLLADTPQADSKRAMCANRFFVWPVCETVAQGRNMLQTACAYCPPFAWCIINKQRLEVAIPPSKTATDRATTDYRAISRILRFASCPGVADATSRLDEKRNVMELVTFFFFLFVRVASYLNQSCTERALWLALLVCIRDCRCLSLRLGLDIRGNEVYEVWP